MSELDKEFIYSGIQGIGETLLDRYENPTSGSLSSELMQDENRLIKKLGEEFAEFLRAILKTEVDIQEVKNEGADLLYAIELGMAREGLTLMDLIREDIRRNRL